MTCSACGEENREDARFCRHCGESLALVCPRCTTPLPPGARFCDACGEGLAAGGAPARQPPEPRAYTPRHLAEQILTSRSALEGERKQVSVLFGDVKGSMDLSENVDPEEWHRILDRFFSILAEGVHRFEGTVNQFTGDGIMALFGAPIAHEDHAQRACLAALHLREELRRYAHELRLATGLSFSVRMGLNSGEVIVGKIGDDLRMDYTAQGHTVGLAARMEQIAEPGRVYLTEHTASLVEGLFRLADLGELELKGARRPLRVFELVDTGPLRTRLDVSSARGFSRFVGRREELRVLETALGGAAARDGQLVTIVGEAGIGKSRLCFEFLERCRARGIEVHTAHAVPYGAALPWTPVLELLRSCFGIDEDDSPAETRRKVAGSLLLGDPALGETLPILFDFLGVPDASRPPAPLDPEARERELFRVLGAICPASRSDAVVLLFEDLHWIDAGSERFLAHIAAAVPSNPILLLLNTRPEYAAPWLQAQPHHELRLEPLDEVAIRALLRDQLGPDRELAGLAEQILARAAGNPFFVEEAVRSLAESGRLRGLRGAYRADGPVGEIAIPPTVQAVLSARIDRLADSDKEVLQTAAVIGKEFAEDLLARVLEIPGSELGASLGVLSAGEFIDPKRLAPNPLWAFRHPLTREVAYLAQLADRRRRIHAKVARLIEADGCDGAEECALLLAHHWEEAGDSLNAVRWALVAGRHASRNTPLDAPPLFRKALALLGSIPESPETLGLAVTARAGILQSAAFVPVEPEELERATRTPRSPTRWRPCAWHAARAMRASRRASARRRSSPTTRRGGSGRGSATSRSSTSAGGRSRPARRSGPRASSPAASGA
jgi:class 3 adenylate cyclase